MHICVSPLFSCHIGSAIRISFFLPAGGYTDPPLREEIRTAHRRGGSVYPPAGESIFYYVVRDCLLTSPHPCPSPKKGGERLTGVCH